MKRAQTFQVFPGWQKIHILPDKIRDIKPLFDKFGGVGHRSYCKTDNVKSEMERLISCLQEFTYFDNITMPRKK